MYWRAGTREVVEHSRDPETNDLVGYFGRDPGEPVYLAQYSSEPILSEDRSRPRHLAEPLLLNGRRPAADRS